MTVRRTVVIILMIYAAGQGFAADIAEGKVLFKYKGQAYTCQDLTLVRYDDALAFINDAKRAYDVQTHRPPKGGYRRPGQDVWKADTRDDFLGFYHHQLNGVIELFVRYQVLEKMRKGRKLQDTSQYYNQDAAERYVLVAADIEQKHFDAWAYGLVNASSPDAFAAMMRKRVRPDWQIEAAKACYASLLPEQPYFILNHKCFPTRRNGKIPPWVRHHYMSSLIMPLVIADIKRDQ